MEKNKDTLQELSQLTPREVYATTSNNYNISYDFTERELAAIDNLSRQIDVLDKASLIGYGADAQTDLANFSDQKLAKWNTRALSVAGNDLTELVTTLKTYDGGEPSKNPIIRWFKSKEKALTEAKAAYSTVLENVNTSEKILREEHLVTLSNGVNEFDQMYDLNLEYFKTLTMYIAAGKKRIEELRTTELPRLVEKARQSGSQLDAQASHDLAEAINSFNSKLYALEISRQLVIQQACQIRQLQKSYHSLADQIQNILLNAIPTWKNQLRISLGVQDAKNAAVAVNAAIDFTESLIVKTAEELAKSTTETARLANRPLTSIEVIQKSNEIFINSIEESININLEGMKNIADGEKIIGSIEEKRKETLLDFSRRISENTINSALGNFPNATNEKEQIASKKTQSGSTPKLQL